MAHPTDIYGNATTPKINMAEQLTLHAGLGCAVGIATGTDCGSGAISGVAGELAAKYAHENGVSRDGSIQVASIIGGGSSAIYSNLVGQSDQEAANNAWEGSRIGRNAAENNATLVVTGTDKAQKRSSSKDLDSDFRESVEKTFNEKLIDFEWSGGNTKEARLEAATKLYDIFKNYDFQPGEKFNLIGFSHGGNVIKEFTQIYNEEKKIDNLIFLGTPHRKDYVVDLEDLNYYANRVSVSDVRDGVQTRGYIDGSVYRGAITIPENIRIMPGFINVRADQNLGPISNHINLPSSNIWEEKVEPYLINK